MEYYSTLKIPTEDGMETLRSIFPTGEADAMNFVIFSTSGVHGSYSTIEDVETDEESEDVTFLVIKPRIVQTLYGNCRPASQEDFDFLKKLRATSREVMRNL